MLFDSQYNHESNYGDEDVEVERDSGMSLATILVLLISLVVVGGTCYGVGYMIGHNSLATAEADKPAPPAVKQNLPQAAPVAAPAAPVASAKSAAVATVNSPQSAATQTTAQTTSQAPTPTPRQTKAHSEIKIADRSKPSPTVERRHPATHTTAVAHHTDIARRPDPFTHLVSNPNYGLDSSPSHPPMVQVAVLYSQEDAQTLLDALGKHGFMAMANRERDNRIHVRLGPFATRDDASAMREKLLNSGYNAVIQ